jgi:hypothetical protein
MDRRCWFLAVAALAFAVCAFLCGCKTISVPGHNPNRQPVTVYYLKDGICMGTGVFKPCFHRESDLKGEI